MKTTVRSIAALIICLTLISSSNLFTQTWPQWRGPLNTGATPSGNPPIEWNEQLNVQWKIRISGEGYSTPAIWGNDIFVTSAIVEVDSRTKDGTINTTKPIKCVVTAIDRATGEIKWERIAKEELPHIGIYEMGTWTSASPITDGKHLYAYFGSRGLFCYTLDGTFVWENDLGDQFKRAAISEGDSPALYKDKIIVNWDHEKQSFIVALDAATGKEIWRKDRDEKSTWMTPLIVEDEGRVHVIVTAGNRVISYSIDDGEILWEAKGTLNSYCMPVASDGVVYVFSGLSGDKALNAIRLKDAKGIVEGPPAVLWTKKWSVGSIATPLLQGEILYLVKGPKGIITSMNVANGTEYYANKRLEGLKTVWASPTGLPDRIYFTSQEGVSMVISSGAEFKVLAKNILDDKFDATPVVVDDELYLRGHQYLYRISK